MSDLLHDWKEKFPELASFLQEKVAPAVDPYGMSYLNAVDASFENYAYEGLATQLLYISENLKPGNRSIGQQLNSWSVRVEFVRDYHPAVVSILKEDGFAGFTPNLETQIAEGYKELTWQKRTISGLGKLFLHRSTPVDVVKRSYPDA